MTRLAFPDEGTRQIVSSAATGPGQNLRTFGSTAVLYTAASGGAVADLRDSTGAALATAGTLTIGPGSLLPDFQGPDDSVTRVLYASIDGSTARYPVLAKTADVVTAIGNATYSASLMPEKFGGAKATTGTGSMSNGSAVLTDSTAAFVQSDQGKLIAVGVTGYSSALVTTILSVQSPTQVTLNASAPSALTSVQYLYGLDNVTALASMATAAADPAVRVIYLAGPYLTSGDGPSFTKRIKVTGHGGLANSILGGSGIATTSPTANAMTIGGDGSSLEDFALWNISATTPTAGAGLLVTAGVHMSERNVTVSGFYDCRDYGPTSGYYGNIQGGATLDPVRYGMRMRNARPITDEGDVSVVGHTFTLYGPRNPASALRWESGGGVKLTGCKFNNGPAHLGKFVDSIDLSVGNGVGTVDFLVTGCSIENASHAGMLIGPPTTTGTFNSIVVTGNQFGYSPYGVFASASSGRMANIVVGDNVFVSHSSASIYAKNIWTLSIGVNNHYQSTCPVLLDSGNLNVAVGQQNINTADGLVFQDNVPLATGNVIDQLRVIKHEYARELPAGVTSTSTWVTLFRVTLGKYSGGHLELTLAANVAGVGGCGSRHSRVFAVQDVGSFPTLATDGTDTLIYPTTGFPLEVKFDNATTANEIAVQVRLNAAVSGGTRGYGLATLRLDGRPYQVRLGA